MNKKIKQFFCLHKWDEQWRYNEPNNFIYLFKYKNYKCKKCYKEKNDSKKIGLSDSDMKEYLHYRIRWWELELHNRKMMIEIAEQMLKKYDDIKINN
jgi:hypothetical protein